MLTALSNAHQAIDNIGPKAGSTTCSIAFEFKAEDGKRYLMSVSVGDTKTYLLTNTGGKIVSTDLTAESRANSKNASEPGGFIGPYDSEKRSPDTSNLSLNCVELPPAGEYMVLTLSDGIHDCMDPEQLKLSPHKAGLEVGVDIPENSKWSDLEPSLRNEIKAVYSQKIMEREVGKSLRRKS